MLQCDAARDSDFAGSLAWPQQEAFSHRAGLFLSDASKQGSDRDGAASL
jgi:hypothetical protein